VPGTGSQVYSCHPKFFGVVAVGMPSTAMSISFIMSFFKLMSGLLCLLLFLA